MADLAGAIRKLRRALNLTQTAFASKVGVNQAAVSQYERGVIQPSTQVLINLYFLSEAQGSSNDLRERFLKELGRTSELGLLGSSRPMHLEEWLAGYRSVKDRINVANVLLEILPQGRGEDIGVRQFVVAVADVFEDCATVDVAISEILHLWVAHSERPEALQYFRDALGFLRANLWKASASEEA